ncbi:MAG: 2-oxoacid:acceptor oxidoreductase subunit alpha [Spirochaetes bacterium]|nr:2-oxoacid:acceptor oxidoreductase subunit alpha [Spirochaetota bacterium]
MNDISIVLSGEAGQGLKTVELVLNRILKLAGYNLFATKEYMSRIRGGNNTTSIRISDSRISTLINRIDILLVLNKNGLSRLLKRITKNTLIIARRSDVETECKNAKCQIIDIPFIIFASNIGKAVYANTVAVGVLCGILKVKESIARDYIKKYFSKKPDEINNNILALSKGYEEGTKIQEKVKTTPKPVSGIKDDLLLNGTEAIALGAIAGGCNFISSYPMSPSTGVLVSLSKNAEKFGIVAEQAEDEISAINMAIGAWYAGARALVTTSGGGFALMGEGLSLAGITETPIVIHLAQRPGPATGLPTRTEQGDLELALYSGHGEFPRILLAPGRIEDGYYLMQKAFDLADRFQVPVIVLTDQYFVDSYYNIPSLSLPAKLKNHFIKTEKNYKRYNLIKNGLSPRGIPGYGKGLVSVDSDEHDQKGHITEDLDLRIKITDKRLKKIAEIRKVIMPPVLTGNKDYKTLLVGWGSTYHVIKEAMENIGRKDLAFLHYNWIWPLHGDTKKYLKQAKKTVIIENNATSQFGKLIRMQTGIDINHRILKYNGLAFSVEEMESYIKKALEAK